MIFSARIMPKVFGLILFLGLIFALYLERDAILRILGSLQVEAAF